jgi:type IX secretion system PorP/SprF family membrane protein
MIKAVKNKFVVATLFVLSIIASQHTFAQQLPQYSQYLFNDFALNPAVAGSRPYYDARTNARNQWVGITDAPRTYILSIHGPLSIKNMGLGGRIYTDIVGPTRRIGIDLSYAYHIQVAQKTRLSFGLSGGVQQFAIDGSKITLRDQGDQYLGNFVQSVIVPDFGFGIYLYHEKYFFSVSLPQITQNRLNYFPNVQEKGKLEDHYYVAAGYKFNLGENFQFEPSALMKYVAPVPMQFDFSGRIIYKEKFWFGGTYRTMDAVSALVGFNVQDNMFFGYSYDYTITNLQKYSSGTHELMLGIKFIPNQPRNKSKSSIE